MPSYPHLPYDILKAMLRNESKLTPKDFAGTARGSHYTMPLLSTLTQARIRRLIWQNNLTASELHLTPEVSALLIKPNVNCQDFDNLPMRPAPPFEKNTEKAEMRANQIRENMANMPQMVAEWRKSRREGKELLRNKPPF